MNTCEVADYDLLEKMAWHSREKEKDRKLKGKRSRDEIKDIEEMQLKLQMGKDKAFKELWSAGRWWLEQRKLGQDPGVESSKIV